VRLFIVRHAKAGPGEPDELRPLTDDGRAAARDLGELLAGEEPRGRELFNSNLPIFQESLKKELNNITLPGEAELAEGIKRSEERYQALAKNFWSTSDLETRRKMYFSELLPLFTEIKNNAQEVIRINQENMVQANHRARSLSADSTRAMVILLVFGPSDPTRLRRRAVSSRSTF
jgi:broad specificity phosphatase PhoE